MSRILRRPMFRGGKVIDSRGTGITSGLMDGGRVGYQSAGFVTGQQIIDANKNNPLLLSEQIKINPLSRYLPDRTTGPLNNLIKATMFDTEQFPLVGKEAKLSDTASLTDFYKSKGDEDEDEKILLASTDTSVLPKKNKKTEASEGSIDTSSIKTEKFKSPTMEIKEKEFSGEIDTTPTIITDEKDEEPVVEDPEKDIKDMADRYFELMGGGKALSRDVGDMLLRFAGAEGETVGDKFKAYLRDEAKAGPSRTEKIKDAAAKTAINYQTQKEFLEKKIASSESIAEKNIAAQALRDLNKTYAPGITQKKIEYLKSLNPNSKEYKLALGDLGLATSFDAQINSDQMSGQPVTIETADTYASIYYPNYKGKLTENSKSGMFLDVANKRLIIVDDTGNFEVFKTLQIQ